jgi:hypothetical protein
MKSSSLAAVALLVLASPLWSQSVEIPTGTLEGTYEAVTVADNSFTMFLNGTQVAEGKSWNTPVETKLTFKKGDILCVIVKDDEGGKSGGLLFQLFNDKKLVGTGAMFKYTVKPADDWMTNPSLNGYLTARMAKKEGQVMLGITNPKYAWGAPRVLTPVLYFKFVNK